MKKLLNNVGRTGGAIVVWIIWVAFVCCGLLALSLVIILIDSLPILEEALPHADGSCHCHDSSVVGEILVFLIILFGALFITYKSFRYYKRLWGKEKTKDPITPQADE